MNSPYSPSSAFVVLEVVPRVVVHLGDEVLVHDDAAAVQLLGLLGHHPPGGEMGEMGERERERERVSLCSYKCACV